MRVSSNPLAVVTSLRLGERVLSRSDDGLLHAEYALFDVTNIVLQATDPVTVREAGYMTTAREALLRLARAGITPELAERAARSLARPVAASFARGPTARAVIRQLGAYELFDGAVYSSTTQSYAGAWLDLRALAQEVQAVGVPASVAALQSLHLVAALAEVPAPTPIHLSTAAAMRDRRPGERTHQRVALDSARDLPDALARVTARTSAVGEQPDRDRRLRQALLARVRERVTVDVPPVLRAHLAVLEEALASRTIPHGPLGDPDLRAIELQLASGDVTGVDEKLDDLERERGRTPGTRYLRARAALLRGDEAPRSVAAALSEIATEERKFHEATLVAARTWLAAGDVAQARLYARRLVEDPTADDSERLVALEIMEATSGGRGAGGERASGASSEDVDSQPPTVQVFPSLGNVPPYAIVPSPTAPPPNVTAIVPIRTISPPRPTAPPIDAEPESNPDGTRGTTEAERAAEARARPRASLRYDPELVESLALPFGASESALGVNELPTTPLQTRIAMTRLARDLARDYRLWYGKALRCNVLAVDAMQQHLTHRFAGASVTEPPVAWELRRHGGLLSEIIARALGGHWVDVAPSEPGYWAMFIPPTTRSHPIGRVYRFVALGHRERDLVSYYLELEARVKRAAP